jgi:hypothetical protein
MISGVLVPIVMFAMIPVTAIGVPLARAYARRLERGPASSDMPPEVLGRLERIEQAVDSIAIEVERISEGQRFTTRLLSDRMASPGPNAVPGIAPPTDSVR